MQQIVKVSHNVHKVPFESMERLPIKTKPDDAEVQAMADMLLVAKIESNIKVFDSWLAIAHWCYQTTRFKKGSDPNMLYHTSRASQNTRTELKVNLSERIRATQRLEEGTDQEEKYG